MKIKGWRRARPAARSTSSLHQLVASIILFGSINSVPNI
jgi:hypothetical protein